MGIFFLPPEPRFFQGLKLANTGYGVSIHFKNKKYLLYFAILSNNNILVAINYLKTMITFKKNLRKEIIKQNNKGCV